MTSSQNGLTNDVVFQKSLKMLMDESGDVHFIFEQDDDVVKLPAHKMVLSASSPVFDAMFNGNLKETGDVKIIDVSVAAFKEFLQFFYQYQVNLTMENIAEVLMLADKYNVATALPICADFLKRNISSDDILWGLHLAFKFGLNELVPLFTDAIKQNCGEVVKMFTVNGSGKGELRSNPINRYIPADDLPAIFSHVFSIIENAMSNPPVPKVTVPEIESGVIPFTLTSGMITPAIKVRELQYLIFSLDGSLLLTDVFLSKLFNYDENDGEFNPIESNIDMWIEEKTSINRQESAILFTGQFKVSVDDGENRIKLPNPITIKPNHFYTIFTKIIPYTPISYTYRSNVPMENIPLAPNVTISFMKRYECYLVSALYFARPSATEMIAAQ